MPLYQELPDGIDTVDVIIAGGGTAGSIVASRLSDSDPDLSVLLIERGANNEGDPLISYPALYINHVMPNSTRAQFVKGNKSSPLADREPILPVASVLGGGSSINMLMYSRAQRSDLDAWKTPGWSAEDLLGPMRKLETYHGRGPKEQHGFDGPIHISEGTHRSFRLQADFLDAIARVGWKEVEDLADLNTDNGAQRALSYISPAGKRQDAATCYLHPRLQDGAHPNLHVLVESKVVKVLFAENKASGVVYQPNQGSAARTVQARKMVILSSGAIGTPLILERSGVGDPEVLKQAGVEAVADVPGVGVGYEDHINSTVSYKSSLEVPETLDGLANGKFDIPSMIASNDKILGWNCLDATCKVRPNDADVAALGPDFQKAWDAEFRSEPKKSMVMLTLIAANSNDPFSVPVGQYFSTSAFLTHPFSRGYVHITGPKLDDDIDFDIGFFSDDGDIDLKTCRWAYKKQREIARRMGVYRGEVALFHPLFPPESQAACVDVDGPLPSDVADIKYTAEDDAVIDEWLRRTVATTWHSMGTCKMLPQKEKGVVDASLSVYGVTGLKVADLSIAPHNVSAHTNNLALSVGERAAEIFIEELGRRI
ncbi:alcohol oxidase-like protein [Durotheca rogersii]|uniref:alcohol oxidase-like protein n=1 Tax=Durotheca rogersii TaxID=419775 RepID=UPI00221FA4B9|nr:alcohol oxidase-like protein [Durotheca rogersii]KAI5867650.1 alcohol oxidase-like protein [Durotheca rogersii]